MRGLGVAIVLGVLVAVPGSAAAQTPDELGSVILTPNDLGPMFTVVAEGPAPGRMSAYTRIVASSSASGEVALSIDLDAGSLVAPAAVVEATTRTLLGAGAFADVRADAGTAPDRFGPDAAVRVLSGSLLGLPL